MRVDGIMTKYQDWHISPRLALSQPINKCFCARALVALNRLDA
jgi:hypothetical protein